MEHHKRYWIEPLALPKDAPSWHVACSLSPAELRLHLQTHPTMANTLAPKKPAAKKTAAKESAVKLVQASKPPAAPAVSKGVLTITSKNYSSWSLRGWLMAKFAGLSFDERVISPDDPSTRADLLLLSSSIRVPDLKVGDIHMWDTLAIAEYLHENFPQAGLLPSDPKARAHCRAICGEMHSGFASLRSALPMNLRATFPKFKIWSRAQQDIDRISTIWNECIETYGGPFLFGKQRTVADAMYAPVCTRFMTYDVKVDQVCAA
jgi:glutathione S-transferase